MRKINRRTALAMAVAAVGGTYVFFGSSLTSTAHARWADHPKLEAAYNHLKGAKDYLEHSPNDFHGHKAEAIKAIDHAMFQIALCSEEEHKEHLQPEPLEEHQKLREAKNQLKEAREYLEKAPHDFHGHRSKSIEAIDEAIKQIDHCLAE